MSRFSSPAAAFLTATQGDDSPEGVETSERLLSRTFLRGFEAGQRLSSREFEAMLPSLLDQFVSARGDAEDATSARRWAEMFLSFAKRRSAARAAPGGGF